MKNSNKTLILAMFVGAVVCFGLDWAFLKYLYANAGEEFYMYMFYKVWPLVVFGGLSIAGLYFFIRFFFELFGSRPNT